jgi:Phage integrase family
MKSALCGAYSGRGSPRTCFMTERGGPMTPKAFHGLFARIRIRAKMPFPIHPHMLRHGCGYALANAGHDTRALQGPKEYPGHGEVHRVGARSVQGFLAVKRPAQKEKPRDRLIPLLKKKPPAPSLKTRHLAKSRAPRKSRVQYGLLGGIGRAPRQVSSSRGSFGVWC